MCDETDSQSNPVKKLKSMVACVVWIDFVFGIYAFKISTCDAFCSQFNDNESKKKLSKYKVLSLIFQFFNNTTHFSSFFYHKIETTEKIKWLFAYGVTFCLGATGVMSWQVMNPFSLFLQYFFWKKTTWSPSFFVYDMYRLILLLFL